MQFMQKNNRESENRVAVFEAPNGPFIKVSQSTMLAERDGFRVTAKSEGRSLLLLPVQYSRCLRIEHANGAETSARLMRANGIQTLIVFERNADVRVRFEFGLFGTAQCRLDDLRDLRSIGLSE